MLDPSLSLLYFPSALMLGSLHALEPGHAKTLTAAYLIGIKGTKRDAVLLGLSVAATHSVVVIAVAILAMWIGQEAFADQAGRWLQIGSGVVVIGLGSWMLWRRWPRRTKAHHHHHHHDHDHDHHHDHGHDPVDMDEETHIRSHAAAMPDYVRQGMRPTAGQIMAFGAAGGMVPCPASITVMLLAMSVGKTGWGLLMVLGFSSGLAVTLVAVGVLIVLSLGRIGRSERFAWISRNAPRVSAGVVILSGAGALVLAM
ncbi:MAG: nickel/cobalt efflux transporter [Phycisphaerales bacterium]